MLDRFRRGVSSLIYPSKAVSTERLRIGSLQPPNLPIYTDMTVRKATREGYKISVFVYRAVRTIIQAASAVPWVVIDKNREPIENHPLELVLRNPNPEFSGQDLIELLIAHLELVGNALWQPVIVRNQIKEIWPVMPDLVRPIPSKVGGEWLKGWDVTVEGRHEMLPPDQFIHFLQVDPGNPYWGMSPLMAAARTVDTDNEAQDTQKISMQNRGLVDGVFTHEALLSQEQFEEATRQIRERFLDKSKRREPWVLGAGAKWNQMSLTAVEMDFIASRLANMRAIGAAFGIDPWWLGDKSASTFSNVAEARKALYEDVVIPLLDDIASTMNLKIAPMYGDITIAYDLSGIPAMREDFGKKVTQAKELWGMGVPFEQINARLEMGFEEFGGWGSGYLPMSLMPTGASGEKPEGEAEEEEEAEEGEKGVKSIDLVSEEAKVAYWKMIDRRRMGWWGVLSKKIKPLYDSEAKEIAKAIKGKKTPEEMEAAAARTIKESTPKWEKMVSAILVTLIEDFGGHTADDLGAVSKSASSSEVKWRFDPFSTASNSWVGQHGAQAVKTILATNLSDVRSVILKGKEANLLMPQIGQNLRGFYSDRSTYKAMRVARTEVSAAAGFGQREAAKQSGIVKTKKWMTSKDDRVRDSHTAMDGEERQLNERYSNGLMYPGDPGGDPAESIQCRCAEQYLSRKPKAAEYQKVEDSFEQTWSRTESTEHCSAILKDGTQFNRSGKSSGISFSPAEDKALRDAPLFIHNHTGVPIPFSPDDIAFARHLNVQRMVVYDAKYKYVMSPSKAWRDVDISIVDKLRSKIAMINEDLHRGFSSRTLDETLKLRIDKNHRAFNSLSKKYGIIYTRGVR